MRRGVRIGVDVGSVRVGLAVSDPDGVLATPVETLPRDTTRAAPHTSDGLATPQGAGKGGKAIRSAGIPTDLARIADEVAERQALEVLVGLPRSLSGGEGPAAKAARAYAAALAELVDVPVRLVDERLSTVAAHRSLREAGMKGRKQRAVVDQVAAVVLLQNALDHERHTGQPPGVPLRQG
jgi:putative Holliday junction resolvase